MTGEGEVLEVIRSAMLPGENMLDVKRPGWFVSLTQTAVIRSENLHVRERVAAAPTPYQGFAVLRR